MRPETCAITLSNVRAPASNRIGREEGHGFKQLTAFFNMTRCFVAAQAFGVARAALEETIAYAKRRHVFGLPLARHQATQYKIAEAACGDKLAFSCGAEKRLYF